MINAARYFWLPVADDSSGCGLVRHAFRGRRADADVAESAHCGRTFAMATPSEMDWICAPTCTECNETLKARQP
ncbi:hypothetical protein [Saccharopolyspora mangrovi]|uniref:Uncharacterized protein n=1 Tax=Saccharopolyspora mangrovi TaxID=3082379 RepID=A0ABU6AA69_9PSEU|nr:hypothetical protein [Saccharopolyspora sp. S2-29]MEB3368436.1 hypothetical protein [Saccharopolyspora sp. S2-29]